MGQQRQNPPIHSSAALHGVARSRVAHLSSTRRKTHFIFLSVPKCYRRLRRRDATTLPLHRSLCTRTCHQFPRRRRRRYHISAAVKARPPSPSLHLTPHCAALACFRKCELFTERVIFLSRRNPKPCHGWRRRRRRGPRGRTRIGELTPAQSGRRGGRIWC